MSESLPAPAPTAAQLRARIVEIDAILDGVSKYASRIRAERDAALVALSAALEAERAERMDS